MNTLSKISRKHFLRLSTMGMAGLGLTPLLGAHAAPAKKWKDINMEGEVFLDLVRGPMQYPGEYMPGVLCNSPNRIANVHWNEKTNEVRVLLSMDNMPYRPTFTHPPGTNLVWPYSPMYPEQVTGAAYQVWLVSMNPFRHRKFYYDGTTLEYLGHDGLVNTPPNDAQIMKFPVQARIGSPLIEPDSNGTLELDWVLDYDALLDYAGNGGQELTFGTYNLKTNAGQHAMINSSIIPASAALTFDHLLAGFGFALIVTIEPNPKPATLSSKANNIVVAGQIASFPVSEGIYLETRREQLGSYPNCGDYVAPAHMGINI